MENRTAQFVQTTKRNEVLNLLKGLACIAVVFIHIHFPGVVGIIIWKSLASFAVPSFLMIAGYFAFGKDETVIKRRMIRILKIFAFGYLCFLGYNVFFQVLRGSVVEWLSLNFKYTTPIKYAVFCTIDFAIPLWYLIAMAETYFVWHFVVKHKKENRALFIMPLLFVFKIVLTTYCATKDLPWMFHINFLTGAMPYFLFGYYLRSKEKFFKSFRYSSVLLVIVVGSLASLIPLLCDFPIKISCIGNIIYSLAIFTLAIKIPDKSYCKPLEYVGDKLSLNVYIFHMLVSSVLYIVCSKYLLNIDLSAGLLNWIRPILVVILTLVWAQVLEKVKIRF